MRRRVRRRGAHRREPPFFIERQPRIEPFQEQLLKGRRIHLRLNVYPSAAIAKTDGFVQACHRLKCRLDVGHEFTDQIEPASPDACTETSKLDVECLSHDARHAREAVVASLESTGVIAAFGQVCGPAGKYGAIEEAAAFLGSAPFTRTRSSGVKATTVACPK